MAFFAAVSAQACPVARAHYALRGAPDITAGFWVIPKDVHSYSRITLHIDFRSQGDHFWFFFDGGSGRFTHLISTPPADAPGWSPKAAPRPLDLDMTIWFADRRYGLGYDVPDPRQPVPAHFFIPEFEETMWYSAEPRRGVPSGFFDLVRCS
jgi:hypothetical protein